jgi:hypothetical protein
VQQAVGSSSFVPWSVLDAARARQQERSAAAGEGTDTDRPAAIPQPAGAAAVPSGPGAVTTAVTTSADGGITITTSTPVNLQNDISISTGQQGSREGGFADGSLVNLALAAALLKPRVVVVVPGGLLG